MSFDWDIRHFPNADSFRQYLATLPRPVWCTGMTVHHTVIPTVATWRGRESMDALGRFYRDDVQNPDGSKGWSAGPQLFIGPDGIWQGTPVHHRGVHAGVCNSTRIGIEVVGNYDNTGWQPPIKGYVYDALTLLCQWLGVESPRINGHRDCNSPKTCPGRAIDLDLVRLQVQTLLSPAPLRAVWIAAGGVGHKDTALGWIPGPGLPTGPVVSAPDGNGILQRCERMYIGIDRNGVARFPLLTELAAWGITV